MKSAFVLTQVGGLKDVAEVKALHGALHAIAGVKTVHFVAGPTDIIVFAEADDDDGLAAVIGQMRATKGVASTDTRIVINM
ncbi:MAG: Lrp/AsnC ligand binding domain-containing protein [Anaerolineales bacterium]